jgi:hypothetical protein
LRRAHAVPLSVEELQILLRDGLRYDLVNQQLEYIQETLQALRAERDREAQLTARRSIDEFVRERIEQALQEVALQHQPVFILAALPIHRVEIPTLFTSRDAEVVRLLEHPPELRRSGFDLDTVAPARIVRGQLRRAVTRGYKLLELWPDGTLIFIAKGDGDFLSRGKHTRSAEPLRLNPLALIESTYLFAELSKQVFDQAQPRPGAINYRLELRNMTVKDTPCGLIPGPLGTFATEFGADIHRAPDTRAPFDDTWSLLARYLTRDDLERFEAVVLEVLGAVDPRFELPPGRRWAAVLSGQTPCHSDHLREGLAETLALMGASSDLYPLTTARTGQQWATHIVRRLFDQVQDWRLWASLCRYLPHLAEAAPEEFLAAVERGLAGDHPVLVNLFSDAEYHFLESSPHIGLLWALEALA